MAPMPGTLLVGRAVFDQVGVFDEAYLLAADVDWFRTGQDAGLKLGSLDRTIMVKRFHPHNLSHSRPEVYEREMVRAMRDSAARQRSRGDDEHLPTAPRLKWTR